MPSESGGVGARSRLRSPRGFFRRANRCWRTYCRGSFTLLAALRNAADPSISTDEGAVRSLQGV